MRCMSCGADIPPAFVHSIENNLCPGCGGQIMNSETRELMDELAEAMAKMPNDPQGVAGWLLSNYRFMKMGDAKPVEKFHRKGSSIPSKPEDGDVSEFTKRSDADKLVQKGKELANKIKGSQNKKMAELASFIQNVESPYGDGSSEISGPSTQDDVDDYEELKSSGIDPFKGSDNIDMSSVINPSDVVSLMSNQGDFDNSPVPEENVLSKTVEGKAFLQQDRLKKLKAQEAISSGGGSFRR